MIDFRAIKKLFKDEIGVDIKFEAEYKLMLERDFVVFTGNTWEIFATKKTISVRPKELSDLDWDDALTLSWDILSKLEKIIKKGVNK